MTMAGTVAEKGPTGAAGEQPSTVAVYILGKKYKVPGQLTIQKAMEYAGYQLIRGCGCRGGICGACGTVYRLPGSYRIQVGLACQTIVQDEMYIAQIPFFPANKAVYDLTEMTPAGETVAGLYPEIFKCFGCNTCTKSCPMDIDVMEYVAQAIRGNVSKAAELSFDCVMCGLCTARCPGELAQYQTAILCRRLYGKYLTPKSAHVDEAVDTVASGKFAGKLKELMDADLGELKKRYVARQVEPDMAEETWKPAKREDF